MGHIPGIRNAIWHDMFIETTFMKYGHGQRGIIGNTLKPETLNIWRLSLHTCSRLEEDMSAISSREKNESQDKHKEVAKARMDSDARDRESLRKKIEIYIDPLDPKKHPQSIVNIATGQLAGETVNVDRAIEQGVEAMKLVESKWPTGFDEKNL